jgi:DNA-binding NarL/FixJ family response regulator
MLGQDAGTIRILLADDHQVVRDGIKAMIARLSNRMSVAAEATNGREVLSMARTTAVDIFVMDISMPGLDGIETTVRLLKEDPSRKIIILSMYDDRMLVEKAMKAGARAYVLKEEASAEISRAIYEVYAGKYYLSPTVSGYMVQGFIDSGKQNFQDRKETALTSRQREILRLICDGYREKEIAQQLAISPHTVHVHKNNIMKILDIHTQAELVKYGIKTGIVQL